VQEATTASHTLDERAGDMHSLVSRFQVSHDAGRQPAALPSQSLSQSLSQSPSQSRGHAQSQPARLK
ncbi:MAG: hypothetical protein GBQ79_18240, partial [Halomonas sp.]|nr:hypothetical protein [Halomonas sp.]